MNSLCGCSSNFREKVCDPEILDLYHTVLRRYQPLSFGPQSCHNRRMHCDKHKVSNSKNLSLEHRLVESDYGEFGTRYTRFSA